MRKPLSPARAVAFHIRDSLSPSFAAFADINKEVASTTTWLVTLSTGLLTFLAVNQGLIAATTPGAARWALTLLFVSTVTGIVQRLAQLQLIRIGVPHNLQLQAWLAIGVTEPERPPPDEVLENKGDIIRHLERFAGGSFEFLRDDRVDLQTTKEIYSAVHDMWKDQEVTTFEALGRLIGAHMGLSAEAGQEFINGEPDVERMRRRGRNLRYLVRASITLFVLAFVSFLAAIGILAFSMLSRISAA